MTPTRRGADEFEAKPNWFSSVTTLTSIRILHLSITSQTSLS